MTSLALRWLNTVLRAVSGNSRDGACFKLDKQTWRRKKQWYTEHDFSKSIHQNFCDIWQDFDFYRILNNANFKMKVEQTNFVIHLIIVIQLLVIDYLKTRLLKLGQISFKW